MNDKKNHDEPKCEVCGKFITKGQKINAFPEDIFGTRVIRYEHGDPNDCFAII